MPIHKKYALQAIRTLQYISKTQNHIFLHVLFELTFKKNVFNLNANYIYF